MKRPKHQNPLSPSVSPGGITRHVHVHRHGKVKRHIARPVARLESEAAYIKRRHKEVLAEARARALEEKKTQQAIRHAERKAFEQVAALAPALVGESMAKPKKRRSKKAAKKVTTPVRRRKAAKKAAAPVRRRKAAKKVAAPVRRRKASKKGRRTVTAAAVTGRKHKRPRFEKVIKASTILNAKKLDKVLYVCGGKKYTGCGGGSHVRGHLR